MKYKATNWETAELAHLLYFSNCKFSDAWGSSLLPPKHNIVEKYQSF